MTKRKPDERPRGGIGFICMRCGRETRNLLERCTCPDPTNELRSIEDPDGDLIQFQG